MPVLSGTLFSKAVDRKIKFKAVIPSPGPTKEADVKTRAPLKTLYLLHGWNGNEEDWLYYSDILRLAEENNLAVIMPDGENSFYSNHATGAMYEEFYAKELIEQTRFLFPLSTRREDTFIGGLSMGGYGALKLGYKYNDVFGKILAYSGFIMHKDERLAQFAEGHTLISRTIKVLFDLTTIDDLKAEDDIYKLIESATTKPQLMIACGLDDYLSGQNDELHEWLTEQGIQHEYIKDAGKHNWAYWSSHIEQGINWLLDKEEENKDEF